MYSSDSSAHDVFLCHQGGVALLVPDFLEGVRLLCCPEPEEIHACYAVEAHLSKQL